MSSDLRPGDHRWRDACETALANSGPERRVGASGEYFLISYYIPASQRDGVQVVRLSAEGKGDEAPRVAIVASTAGPAQIAEIRREYPVVVATFKNVTVLSRPPAHARNN